MIIFLPDRLDSICGRRIQSRSSSHQDHQCDDHLADSFEGSECLLCCKPLPGINRVRDVHHKHGASGVGVQPVPDDAAPHPALIGVSRSAWQCASAFWATLGWQARINVFVRGISDVLSARQGIAVWVLLDEYRQPTEPELLVPCTPDPSLPIDVHVGTDHANEQTSGTVFAHFVALTFPRVALLRRALPRPSPSPVSTLSSVSRLDCPSLSFDLTFRGLHRPGLEVLSRSRYFLLTHGFPPSSSASADLNCRPCPATSHTSDAAASLARNRCTSRLSLATADLAGPTHGLTLGKVGRLNCTGRLLAGRRRRSRQTGSPTRSNIA
jgi:hypothetical protein